MNYKKLSEEGNMTRFEIYNRNSDMGEKHALVDIIYNDKDDIELSEKLAKMICDNNNIYWHIYEIDSEGDLMCMLKIEKYIENWLYGQDGNTFIVKCNNTDLDENDRFKSCTEINVYKVEEDYDTGYLYSRLKDFVHIYWRPYTIKEIYNL